MEKSLLIRRIKMMEIAIMAFAGCAFWTGSLMALLGLLFLMGSQSAFFGPVKYSIMPDHLKADEIVGGNALFMVLSSLAGALILGVAGVSIPVFFLLLALANVAVAVYIYSLVPERFWSRVELVAGPPVAPAYVVAGDLREKVMALWEDKR